LTRIIIPEMKSSDAVSSSVRLKEMATKFDDALLQFKIRGRDLFKEAALIEISEDTF